MCAHAPPCTVAHRTDTSRFRQQRGTCTNLARQLKGMYAPSVGPRQRPPTCVSHRARYANVGVRQQRRQWQTIAGPHATSRSATSRTNTGVPLRVMRRAALKVVARSGGPHPRQPVIGILVCIHIPNLRMPHVRSSHKLALPVHPPHPPRWRVGVVVAPLGSAPHLLQRSGPSPGISRPQMKNSTHPHMHCAA